MQSGDQSELQILVGVLLCKMSYLYNQVVVIMRQFLRINY